MRINQNGEVLTVCEIEQLDSASSQNFQSAITLALPPAVKAIEIDLSSTGFMDCRGVGALVALRKSARHRNHQAILRLRNPSPAARRILSVTGLDNLFVIRDGDGTPGET